MKKYTIRRVEGVPYWSALPYIEIDNERSENPHGITARAQICYNDEELLVHLTTAEKNYIANETGVLGAPCRDSCLEFFFCPNDGDGRYFNIEFNSNGCLYLGIGSGVKDLIRLIPDNSKANILAPSITKGYDGWEIFYRVPYEFIRRFFPDFKVWSGKKMRANCYKCADTSVPAHYIAWSWLEGEPLSFHNTKCFGTMTFE